MPPSSLAKRLSVPFLAREASPCGPSSDPSAACLEISGRGDGTFGGTLGSPSHPRPAWISPGTGSGTATPADHASPACRRATTRRDQGSRAKIELQGHVLEAPGRSAGRRPPSRVSPRTGQGGRPASRWSEVYMSDHCVPSALESEKPDREVGQFWPLRRVGRRIVAAGVLLFFW